MDFIEKSVLKFPTEAYRPASVEYVVPYPTLNDLPMESNDTLIK